MFFRKIFPLTRFSRSAILPQRLERLERRFRGNTQIDHPRKGFRMNFNFFDWLRGGVERSVLLGVTDAVNKMGMPHDDESSRDKILSFLQEETQTTQRNRLASGASSGSGSRSKLGRGISGSVAVKEA